MSCGRDGARQVERVHKLKAKLKKGSDRSKKVKGGHYFPKTVVAKMYRVGRNVYGMCLCYVKFLLLVIYIL